MHIIIPHHFFSKLDRSGHNGVPQESISTYYKQHIKDISYPCFASIAFISSKPINKENIATIDPEKMIEYFVQVDDFSLPFSLGIFSFDRMDKDREKIEKIIQAFQTRKDEAATKEKIALFFSVTEILVNKKQIDLLFLLLQKVATMRFEENKIPIAPLCGLFYILEKHGIPIEKLSPVFSHFDTNVVPVPASHKSDVKNTLIDKFSQEPFPLFFLDLATILSGMTFSEVKEDCSTDRSNLFFQQCLMTAVSLHLHTPLEVIVRNNYFPKEPLYQLERTYLLTILKNGSKEQFQDAIESLYQGNEKNIDEFNKIVRSSDFIKPFMLDIKKEMITLNLPKDLILRIFIDLDQSPSPQNALYAIRKMIEDTFYKKELFDQIKDIEDQVTIASNCTQIIPVLDQSIFYAYCAEMAPQDAYIEIIIREIEQSDQKSLLFPININSTNFFISYKKTYSGKIYLKLYQENKRTIKLSLKNNIKDKETWNIFYKTAESSSIEEAFIKAFSNESKVRFLPSEKSYSVSVIKNLLSYVETRLIDATSLRKGAIINQMLHLYFFQEKKELNPETDLPTICVIDEIEKREKGKEKKIPLYIMQWTAFFNTFEMDIEENKQYLITELQNPRKHIKQRQIPISSLRFAAIALTLPRNLIKPFFENFTFFRSKEITSKDKKLLLSVTKNYEEGSIEKKIAAFISTEPSKEQQYTYMDVVKCIINKHLHYFSTIVIDHGRSLSITPFDSFYLKYLFQFKKNALKTLSSNFERFSSLYSEKNFSGLYKMIISLSTSERNQFFQILQREAPDTLIQKYIVMHCSSSRQNDPQKSKFLDAIFVNFFLDRHTFLNQNSYNGGQLSASLALSKEFISGILTKKGYPTVFDSAIKDKTHTFFKNIFLPLLSHCAILAFTKHVHFFFQEGKQKLMGLQEGQSMLIPFSISEHAILLRVEKKNNDTVALTLYNTGLGIGEYHKKKGTLFQTFIEIEGVPISTFMEFNNWKKIFDLQFSSNIDHPYSTFFTVLGRNGKVLPPSQDKEDYALPQKHGSCAYLVVFHCMRHMLTKEPFESKKEAIAIYKEIKNHLFTNLGDVSKIKSLEVNTRTRLKKLKIKKRTKLLTKLRETEEKFTQANTVLNKYRKELGIIEREKEIPESPFERYQRLEKTIKNTLKIIKQRSINQIPLIQDEHPILGHLMTRYAYKKWTDKNDVPKMSHLKISLNNFDMASLEEKISFLLHDYELEV